MPTKIVVCFNRADEAGWSETYYYNQTSISGAIAGFAPVLAARRQLLSSYCYVYAVRYTLTGTPPTRQSRLVISQAPAINPTGTGTGAGNLDPDSGTVGALCKFFTASGQSENRLVRGLPDQFNSWSASVYRMQMTTAAEQLLDSFAVVLTAQANGMGWLPRGNLTPGQQKATAISTVTQIAPTQVGITLKAPATLDPLVDGSIILSGFRGVSAPLNGQYGYHQWIAPTTTSIVLNKVVSEAAVQGYGGTGAYMRTALNLFANYLPSTSANSALVRSRNIGNPFGRTRGRRRVAR